MEKNLPLLSLKSRSAGGIWSFFRDFCSFFFTNVRHSYIILRLRKFEEPRKWREHMALIEYDEYKQKDVYKRQLLSPVTGR